jgi:hypothetical protein
MVILYIEYKGQSDESAELSPGAVVSQCPFENRSRSAATGH